MIPCVVNLHNAVTVSQQRLGKRVAQISAAGMNEMGAALRFFLGRDSSWLPGASICPRISPVQL
jgi:hypothetical protein